MVHAAGSEGPSVAAWEAFARRQAGNPFLEQDPLYALSAPVIDAIKDKVPKFFTEAQERFERDLAQAASFGFFHHHALGRTAADRQADPQTGLSWQERHERSTRDLDALLVEELRRGGLTEYQIDEYLRQGAEGRAVIDSRQGAYAGWLICNRGFREEVDALRADWEPLVRRLGRFPRFPRWPFIDDLGGGDVPGAFWEAWEGFYRRWGLDQMLTWDWPVPMEPDLVGGMLQDLHRLGEAGVVLFLPWYLLRGERLNVHGVVQRARTASEADHLRAWLHQRPGPAGDELGEVRFERLLWLYRYQELVLARRYRPACRGHLQRLDQALASVIHRDEDTVKKLRLELRRALQGS